MLVALGQTAAQVLLIRQARRPHMRWHILLVLLELLAQPLAIDQQLVVQAGPGFVHHGAHIAAGILVVKHHLVEAGLKRLSKGRPVGAHRFEPLEHQLLLCPRLLASHQPRVAFLAPLLQPADGGHQEAAIVGLVLDLQIARQVELALDQRSPVIVDHLCQPPANLVRLCGTGLLAKVHEGGVGVAIDHLETLPFDPLPGLLHDAVTAQGDGGGKPRVVEAAAP